ncbi:MAG: hypothetical protein KDK12_18365 [Rhodobacteraceae bacterium]|nr:hypothetical protein [Paracoccaceae bacterium]
MIRRLAALALAATLTPPGPLWADPTDPLESSAYYGSVRNWLVEALNVGGVFTGCRATIPLQSAGPLLLERSYAGYGDWTIFMPTSQAPSPVFGRRLHARFSVDQDEVPTEVLLYPGGWASMALDEPMRQRLMDGNILTAQLAGEETRQWILNGSTAALELAQECYERQGAVW